jgi:hypothetical protein
MTHFSERIPIVKQRMTVYTTQLLIKMIEISKLLLKIMEISTLHCLKGFLLLPSAKTVLNYYSTI